MKFNTEGIKNGKISFRRGGGVSGIPKLYVKFWWPLFLALKFTFLILDLARERGGHSGLNQGVRPSYYSYQISPRTLCMISTDYFAEDEFQTANTAV